MTTNPADDHRTLEVTLALCSETGDASSSMRDLVPLLDQIVDGFAGKRIECFVKTDSDLHHCLLAKQFSVPEFFNEIGPLVKWRKGKTGKIGTSNQVRSLSWF